MEPSDTPSPEWKRLLILLMTWPLLFAYDYYLYFLERFGTKELIPDKDPCGLKED
jgi:hypothetical protein